MFRRRRQKFTALIALCALLFSALLPAASTLARATGFANDVLVMGVICTTHDANVTSAPSAPSAPAAPLAAHSHCALCSLGGSAALTPCAVTLNLILVAPAAPPQLFIAIAPPRENFALHPLVPRAPPRVL